jgi:hypothetical protein
MVHLADTWLPILASAALVFVASSVIHMALPLHRNDQQKLPNEDDVLDVLRRPPVRPGMYMFPCPESMAAMQSPEMQAKLQRGPIGTLIVRAGHGIGLGKALLQWFVYCLFLGVFVAYLASLALPAGAGFQPVFRFTATAALLAHGFWSVNDSIWKGISWGVTGRFVVDGVIYALATGAAFGWLWPAG